MKRIITLLIGTLFHVPLQAALLNLSTTPLGVTSPVPPNVFFMIDDSRTMDYETMAIPLWDACAYDPNVTGTFSNSTTCGAVNYKQGQFYSYNGSNIAIIGYIYQNGDNVNNGKCDSNGSGALSACPTAAAADWRILSSDANVVYYNPSISYQAWPGPCYASGNYCQDASFTAAQSYPVEGTSGYSMTRNLSGAIYSVWVDDHGFTGTRPLRGTALNVNGSANGVIDLWDSHVDIVLNSTNAQIYTTTYTPTNKGMNPTVTLRATLSDTTSCYNVLGSTTLVQSIFRGALGYTSTGATGCMTLAQAQQNFADYYQYTRRRAMVGDGAVSAIVDAYPNLRYGLGNSHQTNPPWVSMQAFPFTTTTDAQNLSMLKALYGIGYNNDTKLRAGLDAVGLYYSHNLPSVSDNPIACSTQRNYAVLITDGYWNDSFNASYGDVDQDGVVRSVSDVARYYYVTNLQPNLTANQVQPTPDDPATWLHMNTLVGAFGDTGYLTAGDNGWPTPSLQTNSNWGNPYTDPISQTDDLWHAAFDGLGSFFSMQDPNVAVDAIANTINVTTSTVGGTGMGVAQSSTILNTGAQVYQGTYNSTDWVGDLVAYSLSLNGVLATTPSWSANCLLTGGTCSSPAGSNTRISPDSRVIITRNWSGANNGVAFRWPSNYTTYKVGGAYPTNLTNFMANAPYKITTTTGTQITANQAYGQALLNYLRGDRTNEVQNNGSYAFRNRDGILGDIVNSVPDYVGPPSRIFPDNLEASPYSTFKSTYANRPAVVYVGANDGMLHGFNASTGQEVLAYIPGAYKIYKNLPSLSSPSYTHYFFVDGTPKEGDVYFNNAWHTILVGALRNGGQGIYALDITDPANFTETNASNIYLWEFTDSDDPDVGYARGPVSIAKVRTGAGQSEWAVIFGSGYNNSEADGHQSSTGKAALFILLINRFNGTWTLNSNYYKFVVGTGSKGTPNGLASPFVASLNNSYIADYVYAGDLTGNLWKFDLTSSTPTNWTSSTLFTAYYSKVGDQPITDQPIVGPHPNGLQYGVLVYFGTGKFLEPSDNSATGQTTQTFYAIWDKLNNTTVNKSQLVQQQILGSVTTSTGTFRAVSSNPINWNTGTSQNLGWYMNLIENGATSNYGERVINQATLRNGNIIFPTLFPTQDACVAGGGSYLMELSASSGGTPNPSPFDVSGDGSFTSADYITLTINGVTTSKVAAGLKSTVGMLGVPAILLSPDKSFETKVLSGSSGITTIKENPQGIIGRQNWRQIY